MNPNDCQKHEALTSFYIVKSFSFQQVVSQENDYQREKERNFPEKNRDGVFSVGPIYNLRE